MFNRSNTKRGASLLGYGLVVGLIAVVALASVTQVGGNVRSLFGEVSDQLETGAAGGGAGSGEAASASPTPVNLVGALNSGDPGRYADGSHAITCEAYKNPSDPSTYTAASSDGVYLIDPDGTGGNAAFQVWCDQTTSGGGWTMIRRVGNTSAWWPHDDNFNCAQTHGTYLPSDSAGSTFGMNWCGLGSSEVLLQLGDKAHWIVVSEANITSPYPSPGSCGETVTLLDSSDPTSPATVGACLRAPNPEDPWLSKQNHTHLGRSAVSDDEVHSMLWGENGLSLWLYWIQNHGGSNAFVR
ncbi:MAG: hypothetical protein Alpg2KO_16160 [Alphaproteobacteria bacterium]